MKTWLKKADLPFVAIMSVSFALVYLIPPHWVRAVPGVDLFLHSVYNYVPGTRGYIDASKFRDIAFVYYPILALMSPVAVWSIWRLPTTKERWFTNFWGRPVVNALRMLVLGAVIVGFFWVTYMKGGGQLESLPTNDSKFFLALLGHIAAGTAFWGMLALLARAFLSIFHFRST